MQTISIISLKGGVAKTTTAVNMAYTLAAVHNKKVLIIDNDKQGNTSKAFKKYDTEDKNTVARMMLERNIDVSEIIKKTDYENIDIITANMDLLEANLRTIVDTGRQQQTRFKKALSNSKVLDHGWAKFDYLPLTEAYKETGSLTAKEVKTVKEPEKPQEQTTEQPKEAETKETPKEPEKAGNEAQDEPQQHITTEPETKITYNAPAPDNTDRASLIINGKINHLAKRGAFNGNNGSRRHKNRLQNYISAFTQYY